MPRRPPEAAKRAEEARAASAERRRPSQRAPPRAARRRGAAADDADAVKNSGAVTTKRLGAACMSDCLKIALAQLNLLVGDVQGNATASSKTARRARADLGADLVLFPELDPVGLSARGSALSPRLSPPDRGGLARLRAEVTEVGVMLGFPEYTRPASTTPRR